MIASSILTQLTDGIGSFSVTAEVKRLWAAYQRHTQHRIAWNHVFWITFVVITAFLIAFISIVAVLSVIKPDMPDEMSGKIGIAAAAALAITALTLLTHQHPFHRAHLLFPEQA